MTILTKNTDILRAEVKAHLDADALMRGAYWAGADNGVGGKGCFIGCLTHSNDPTPAFERFGLPVAVMRIAENIFEALPDEDGKAFFAALPEAVGRDGKDLSRVHWAFMAAELRALTKTTHAIQAVTDPIIDGMDLLASGKAWPEAHAAARAAYAADAAAYAAARAARAAYAAYAADAARAAYAAARAAYAADAAADAARAARAADADAAYAADAAADAARAARAADADAARYVAARIRQRDTLLAIIAAA